jgi:hypothetical protein
LLAATSPATTCTAERSTRIRSFCSMCCFHPGRLRHLADPAQPKPHRRNGPHPSRTRLRRQRPGPAQRGRTPGRRARPRSADRPAAPHRRPARRRLRTNHRRAVQRRRPGYEQHSCPQVLATPQHGRGRDAVPPPWLSGAVTTPRRVACEAQSVEKKWPAASKTRQHGLSAQRYRPPSAARPPPDPHPGVNKPGPLGSLPPVRLGAYRAAAGTPRRRRTRSARSSR